MGLRGMKQPQEMKEPQEEENKGNDEISESELIIKLLKNPR